MNLFDQSRVKSSFKIAYHCFKIFVRNDCDINNCLRAPHAESWPEHHKNCQTPQPTLYKVYELSLLVKFLKVLDDSLLEHTIACLVLTLWTIIASFMGFGRSIMELVKWKWWMDLTTRPPLLCLLLKIIHFLSINNNQCNDWWEIFLHTTELQIFKAI